MILMELLISNIILNRNFKVTKWKRAIKMKVGLYIITVLSIYLAYGLMATNYTTLKKVRFAYKQLVIIVSIYHKWIVLFTHADSPSNSQRKTKWLPVSNNVTLKEVKLLFGSLVIQLVWYILKELFTCVGESGEYLCCHFVAR